MRSIPEASHMAVLTHVMSPELERRNRTVRKKPSQAKKQNKTTILQRKPSAAVSTVQNDELKYDWTRCIVGDVGTKRAIK